MLEVISGGFDFAKSLGELIREPLMRHSRQQTLLRLLYLENTANLELFCVIPQGTSLRTISIEDPRFRWIVGGLSTKAIELILMGDTESFNSVRKMKEDAAEESEETGRQYPPINNVQRLRYIAIKTAFLRSLVSNEGQLLETGVKAGLRLERIREQFLEVQKSLRESKQVRNFIIQ